MAARFFENLLKSLDEIQLEQWVFAYVNCTFQTDQRAQRIGRKGQLQKGVDVHAVIRGIGQAGYQAKAYVNTQLTVTAFDEELAAAHTFAPPLNHYTIVTLNPRDAKLQEHARLATLHGHHAVSILALEDLADIATANDELRRLLCQFVLSADDIGHLLSPYLVDATSLPVKVLSIEPDRAMPEELQTVDDWINAGMPRRALEALAVFVGPISQSTRCRLECRAHYSLDDYSMVVHLVEAEQARPNADPTVLALGAQAAEHLDDQVLADQWLNLALARADERDRPDVVAAYVRIHSLRPGTHLTNLESFAASTLSDPSRVSAALGDAAANLDNRPRALHWYKIARERRPNRPLGVELNATCSAVVVALGQTEAGAPADLTAAVGELEALAAKTLQCEAPAYACVAFNTLGFAYRALGRHLDATSAWDTALASTESDFGLWVRRCAHSANERTPAPSAELIAKHATTHVAGLVLATALMATGQGEEARPWIQRVLDDPSATIKDREIAQVEQMRLQKVTGEYDSVQALNQVLALLAERPQSVPLLWWAVLQSSVATRPQQAQLRTHAAALSLPELADAQVLGFGTTLVDHDFADIVISWLPRIEAIAFDENKVRNREAAELVADLYLMSLRFEEAISVRKRLLQLQPENSTAVQQYARALHESGDREGAYRVLQASVEAGTANSQIVLNWAMLAMTLGHRREAHRVLRDSHLSLTSTPSDYTRMLQAKTLLGVKGGHDDVLAGLRKGFVTPDNAATIFGVGLRRHVRRNPQVAWGTIIQLQIPDAYEGTICIVEKPALPLPSIHTFDGETHPWVADLLGAQAGDAVDLTQGAFQGKRAFVLQVKEPADWLVQQAHELIAISSYERTGVEAITGELSQQIEITREKLKHQRETVKERMQLASTAQLPISSLAEKFQTSAREFLQAGAGWKPTAHSGTVEAIAEDDVALQRHNGLIFDPTTLLLLVAIGAESLITSLPLKPSITRHAAWQLFDWYIVEREGRRATAHLQLADDGRLIWTEYRARHRALLLKHWRTIDRLVRTHFEIVDTAPLAMPSEKAQLLDFWGVPLLSGLTTANKLDRVLIAEEHIVRCAAQFFDAKTASLQRLIAYAETQRWISRTRATLWLAALIRMGWTWVTFPSWTLDHALCLDNAKRWPTAEAYLSRLRGADPNASLSALLAVLTKADANGYRDVNVDRLRSLIFKALPRVDSKARAEIAARYAPTRSSSRKQQATRKMLLRWAAEHSE